RNIVFEVRWAEGKVDRFPDLATELVGLKFDAIHTVSTPGAACEKPGTCDAATAPATSRQEEIEKVLKANFSGLRIRFGCAMSTLKSAPPVKRARARR